jgi:hypothetical protein
MMSYDACDSNQYSYATEYAAGLPTIREVGFEVFTAVSTKMLSSGLWCRVVWRSLPMMEAARTYETLVNYNQTTRRYNPGDSHIYTGST